jgi:hypothetical protein
VQGLDNTAVTWSLAPTTIGGSTVGSISQAGVYSAPASGSGSALVVATSQADPTVVGQVYVEAGTCSCSWTLTIEGGGAWSGDFASHAFAGQFSPFSMTFAYLDPTADGSGTVQIFEANGPTTGATGSWDCNFSWLANDQFWVSTNTEGTASTLTVDANTGAQMKSVISGTVLTAVGGEDSLQSFTMTIRSGDLFGSGGVPCEVEK